MILVDTHIALWIEMSPERISARALGRIEAAQESGEKLAISCATFWEISSQHADNRLTLFRPCRDFLLEMEKDFTVLPLDREVALKAAGIRDAYLRDPMDRIIVGTALSNGLSLITRDEHIRKAAVCPTIW